ncbi:MAG: site-specific DNA-methyltransferase [Anaerolineae bacterium]|nr:site-specific DNA-methyltransferase [Thermoflexales bacterium]MDW8226583.1 site-specific DNA-methyltransferase [Anaerolineales bacterium]MDW8407210.1 site-specific DNA-methyltransferase [Anaerolineae bacterium]
MSELSLFRPSVTIESRFDTDAQIVLLEGDVNERISQIPDRSISLVITSPPYNLGKEYEQRFSVEEYLASNAQIISQLHRVLREDGSICWQVGNFVEVGEVYPLDILYYPIFKKLGMKLRNRIVWKFGHGLHASRRFSGRYETILWFTKTEDYIFNLDPVRVPSKYPGKRYFKGPNKGKPSGNPLGKNPSDVWEVIIQDWEELVWDIPNVKANHPEKTIHPCQFPIELVERCVLALTREGDWVFDPFMGVGSALIAALMHSRRAVGCDKEATYVEIARRRITDYFNGSLRYRQIGKPVYQPTGRERVSQPPEEWRSAPYNTRLLDSEPK